MGCLRPCAPSAHLVHTLNHWFAQGSGDVQNGEISWNSTFLCEIPYFHRKYKKVVAEFAKIQFSAPARPGCARPYKTNAIPSLFRGSWRPGAHFRKKSLFHKIITKNEKSDFLADFSFFDENHDFREIHRLAKTPVFIVVYQ